MRMRRTLATLTLGAALGCGESSGPVGRTFPAGTYDLVVPYNNVSSWSAPVPASFTTAGPACGQFVGGTITIAASGATTARRTFRQGEATYEQELTGTARFQDGVLGFLIDYGPQDEHAHAEQEGTATALYVGHIFPARGECSQATAAVRYLRRQSAG